MTASTSPSPVAEIRVAGMATVQDLGRPGHARQGVSANGASDRRAARTANVLVGNDEGAALIEVTASAFALVARRPMLVATTGAAEGLRIAGMPRRAQEPHVLWPGDILSIEAPRHGMRSYLAVHGALGWPRVLGSVAPDPLLDFGHRLRAGDLLEAATSFDGLRHPDFGLPLLRLGADRPPATSRVVVDVVAGPEAEQFPDGLNVLASEPYELSEQSDHMGLRVAGPRMRRQAGGEMLTRGVPVGAVEVPPSGELLVLMRARYVTAGYPVLAVVAAASMDVLAQARPGDPIRFRVATVEQALQKARTDEAAFAALKQRARRAFAAHGLGRAEHLDGEPTAP